MKQFIIFCTTVLFMTIASYGQNLKDSVVDYDGNIYHTVKIGTQTWMIENLKVSHYRNGDLLMDVKDSTEWGKQTTGAFCNYNNDTNIAKVYGSLYNWYAINDNRNIAPKGWHVSTDSDWQTLIAYLGGESVAGDKMKEADTTHWKWINKGTSNSCGFTGLPGGWRKDDGRFDMLKHDGLWWLMATEFNTRAAWYRLLIFGYSDKYVSICGKTFGLSVRCVKD